MRAFIFYLITLLLFNISCSKEDSTSKNHTRNLGWGLDIANKIRDQELPEGYLVEILSGNLDNNGNLISPGDWDFWYVDTSAQDIKYLNVIVNYDGTASYRDPHGAIDLNKIPDYTSAAEWIKRADQAMKENNYNFVNRYIQVFAPDYCPPYVGIYYDYPHEGIPYVCVWLNADTNEFIEFDFL